MSGLRKALIRLAHAKPELRKHLLPLLKEASGSNQELSPEILAERKIRKDKGTRWVECPHCESNFQFAPGQHTFPPHRAF